MSATNSLHYELCVKAGAWIRQKRNAEPMQAQYKWSAVELNCWGGECPDVWASNGYFSCIIEVKTSRADFINDQKKVWRTDEKLAMGNYRYYLCPKGLVAKDELPHGWGLIEYDGKRLRKVMQSSNFENVSNRWDNLFMSSIMRREGIRPQTFNYRFNSTMYNDSYHSMHITDEMRNEYLKCREDFGYFMTHYCKVMDETVEE